MQSKVRTIREFISFGLVGLSGVGIGLAVMNAVMRLYPKFVVANVAAFFIAVTWNFLLNRRFTFCDSNHRSFFVLWSMFAGSSLVGAASNWAVSFSLYFNVEFFKQHYNLPAICGVAAGCIANFLLAKLIVFRPMFPKEITHQKVTG